MAITWSIVQLDYALSEDGHTDVVNNSHWQCIDEDASGNQARVYGSVAIPTDDLSNFTPYADITEAEALQWTKDALGAEEVASIEANVAAQLQLIENPTEGSGTRGRLNLIAT
jgi:hypothetical protein